MNFGCSDSCTSCLRQYDICPNFYHPPPPRRRRRRRRHYHVELNPSVLDIIDDPPAIIPFPVPVRSLTPVDSINEEPFIELPPIHPQVRPLLEERPILPIPIIRPRILPIVEEPEIPLPLPPPVDSTAAILRPRLPVVPVPVARPPIIVPQPFPQPTPWPQPVPIAQPIPVPTFVPQFVPVPQIVVVQQIIPVPIPIPIVVNNPPAQPVVVNQHFNPVVYNDNSQREFNDNRQFDFSQRTLNDNSNNSNHQFSIPVKSTIAIQNNQHNRNPVQRLRTPSI